MNWNGSVIIDAKLGDVESHYIFRNKGILKSGYVLLDSEEEVLAVIQPDFKWSAFNFDYDITTSEVFDGFEHTVKGHDALLLLTIVHCANYYMAMMTTIGSV